MTKTSLFSFIALLITLVISAPEVFAGTFKLVNNTPYLVTIRNITTVCPNKVESEGDEQTVSPQKFNFVKNAEENWGACSFGARYSDLYGTAAPSSFILGTNEEALQLYEFTRQSTGLIMRMYTKDNKNLIVDIDLGTRREQNAQFTKYSPAKEGYEDPVTPSYYLFDNVTVTVSELAPNAINDVKIL